MLSNIKEAHCASSLPKRRQQNVHREMRTVNTQQGTIEEWEIGRYPKRPPPHRQRHGCSISRRGPSTICATAQQFPSWTKASQSYELSRLQSLLQIQSRAAALMLVREDPGILELSPAFIMQRLVDLKESRPAEDPADLIFMEPDLLVEHPADEAYCIAQGRAVNAVRIFRGTHPDAIYLSKEIKNLAIPPHRRIADIIKYVPLFYRVQRPVLRTGLADRGSVTRLRNLLIDFNSACYELKRDQQAIALLHAAMQRQSIEGTLSRGALLQLEGDDLREALSKVLIPPGRKTKNPLGVSPKTTPNVQHSRSLQQELHRTLWNTSRNELKTLKPNSSYSCSD